MAEPRQLLDGRLVAGFSNVFLRFVTACSDPLPGWNQAEGLWSKLWAYIPFLDAPETASLILDHLLR
ncbi:hypothetical protein WK54_07565 [Burkholderia ubonensis]|nr:hypothetical protein WK54_07565 [Burkholderia ubonensis]